MNENLLLPSMKPTIFISILLLIMTIGFYIKCNQIIDKLAEHDSFRKKDFACEQRLNDIDFRLKNIEDKLMIINKNISLRSGCQLKQEFKAER